MLPFALFLSAVAAPAYGPDLNGRIFDRVWEIVDRRYWNRGELGPGWDRLHDAFRQRVVAAPDAQAVYAALDAMLGTLHDSHVFAVDPRRIAIGRDRADGRPEAGFGFEMMPDDKGVWHVTGVGAGSPAARAGVEIGWTVTSVAGRPVDADYTAADGQRVAVRFLDDDGRARDIVMTAVMEQALPPLRAARLPGGVLYVAIDGFDRGDDRWLAARIAESPRPSALILDLRNNGGGDADAIARVGGLFFRDRRLLVRRIAGGESDQQTRAAGRRSWTGPLAVLIGPNSASGAEAIAAMIDESGRGITIGERTAGALTGAAEYPLPDGGLLSVAEFDIRTAGGQRLEGKGLAPRVAVAPSLADRRAGRDPVLAKAQALLEAQVATR